MSRDSVGADWSEPVQLSDSECEYGDWAPGGERIVCDWHGDIKTVSRDGVVLWQLAPPTAGLAVMTMPEFSADGSTIYFYGVEEDGSQGVWSVPAAGGYPRLVIESDDPSLWFLEFSLTVGPEHIYLAVGEYESDIWVMDLEY